MKTTKKKFLKLDVEPKKPRSNIATVSHFDQYFGAWKDRPTSTKEDVADIRTKALKGFGKNVKSKD